jgi:hypothetical protein
MTPEFSFQVHLSLPGRMFIPYLSTAIPKISELMKYSG